MFPYKEGVPSGRKKKWKTLALKWKTDFLPGVDWVGGAQTRAGVLTFQGLPLSNWKKKENLSS